MTVLALELSSSVGSVAVLRNSNQMLAREFPNDRHNSARFFEAITAARESFAELHVIVVGSGPGSYAGTRIAISTAIGLQLATGARLAGVPSICAFAVPEAQYYAVGDARRNSFWIAAVSDGVCVEMPQLVGESELRERLDAAPCRTYSAEALRLFPTVTRAYPSALRLAQIGAGDHPNAMQPPLQPIYLREPHITVSQQPVWKGAK